jgi:hypothetical protein
MNFLVLNGIETKHPEIIKELQVLDETLQTGVELAAD